MEVTYDRKRMGSADAFFSLLFADSKGTVNGTNALANIQHLHKVIAEGRKKKKSYSLPDSLLQLLHHARRFYCWATI